jgi:MarR family transcriptional regulator, lower aerobic nicotinate degradation pathway regulator
MSPYHIPSELNDALGFNIYRVALLFRKELIHALADYQMTPEQWQIMRALWSTNEQLNQNEIAHLTLKDKHSVSRILARLERDGWIVRHPHPTDARATLIAPTEQAEHLRQTVPAQLYAHFAPILGVLSEDEARHLLTLLHTLRLRLGDEVSEESPETTS